MGVKYFIDSAILDLELIVSMIIEARCGWITIWI